MAERMAKLEQVIHEIRDEIPVKTCNLLRERFEIEGAVAVTVEDVQKVVFENNKIILDKLNEIVAAKPAAASTTPPHSEVEQGFNRTPHVGGFTPHFWGGQFRMVPEGFRWPTGCPAKTMWDLWWFGHHGENIPPYRYMKEHLGDLVSKGDNQRFSRTQKVINMIVQCAKEKGCLPAEAEVRNLSREASENVFSKGFEGLMEKLYGGKTKKRLQEIQIDTLANKIYGEYNKK
jgi:hypothetical protein